MKNERTEILDAAVTHELLIGLLADFQEHAHVVLQAKADIGRGVSGDDHFDEAVAQLDAALTALNVTVPALLRELDRLDDIQDETR